MHVSEDGYATGSIDVAELAKIEPKTDEAKAQRIALGIPFEEPKPEKASAAKSTSSKKE